MPVEGSVRVRRHRICMNGDSVPASSAVDPVPAGSIAVNVRPITDVRAVTLRFSVPLVLGAIVTTATAVHAMLALRSPSPWIVPDELIYAELAKSLAKGELPSIRDEISFAYGLGYPALLAPIWAVFDDATKAYALAKVLNACVLSLTAVPAYFLARRFVAKTHALVVAALSVCVPSMLYAGTLMTEVALYPAFVLALLAMAVAIESPARTTQAAALGAIAFACTIKSLAVVLVCAYVTSIVLHIWLDTRSGPRSRARLLAFSPTWLALSAAALVASSLILASGRSLQDALGAYSVVLDHIDLSAAPWWVLLHLAEFDLYLAVIPFAATMLIVASGLRRDADQPERLFVALVVPVCAVLFLAVAAFASTPSPGGLEYPENVSRLHERSTFLLAPLFLIGLMLWLRDRRGRPAVLLGAVTGAALLPAVIPLGDFDGSVRFQALALVPWVALADDLAWPLGGLLFTCTLGVLFVVAMRARASVAMILAPIVFVFAVVGLTAHDSIRSASEWTRSAAWGKAPNWVDAAVGEHESVSVLWAEPAGRRFVDLAARHRVVFVGEFFNRSIGDLYELGSPMPYGLPATQVHLEAGRIVLDDGRPAPLGQLVLAPCYVRVAGVPIARDLSTGAVVVRVRGPIRAVVARPAPCPRTREP